MKFIILRCKWSPLKLTILVITFSFFLSFLFVLFGFFSFGWGGGYVCAESQMTWIINPVPSKIQQHLLLAQGLIYLLEVESTILHQTKEVTLRIQSLWLVFSALCSPIFHMLFMSEKKFWIPMHWCEAVANTDDVDGSSTEPRICVYWGPVN